MSKPALEQSPEDQIPVTLTQRHMQEFENMANAIAVLQEKLRSLQTASNPLMPTSPPVKEPRVSDPEHFDGSRHLLRNFIAQIKLVIQAQPSRFATERQKVIFAATFLRGPAFSWLQPYLESLDEVEMLNNLTLFFKELQNVFGDPDKVATAERQLCKLKQTRSVANYATDFHRLSALTQWNDPALCYQFYEGLKNDVKDELSRTDRPKDLAGLIALAVKVDTRIYERHLEKYNSSPRFFPRPTPVHVSAQPVPASKPIQSDAMEIDGTRAPRQSLTPQEKQRRRDNNLCLYCGQAGHMTRDCSIRPQDQRPSALFATTSSNSSNDQISENIYAQRQ